MIDSVWGWRGRGEPLPSPIGQGSATESSNRLVTQLTSLATKPLVAQLLKNLCAIQETWVLSLGWEGALEKGMATHSSFLAWRIPWTV